MVKETYQSIKKRTKQVKKTAEDAVKTAEEEKDDFVKKQTFTGEELIEMRDQIIDGYHGSSDEPNIHRILDRILEYKESQ